MSEGFIDPERLAAFLEGRLPPEEHEQFLQQLAWSAESLEILASASLPRTNPFQPTRPTMRKTFVGRRREVARMITLLNQTRSGNATNLMVIGESGMGKSSLLFHLKSVAEGQEGSPFRFLVIDTDIEPSTTQKGLLSKIVLGLERGLASSERSRTFFKDFLAFATRLEALGVSIREAPNTLDEAAMERFADHLARTVDAVTGPTRTPLRAQHDGVLLIIDEADKASPDLRLGSFLKLLVERLHRRNCQRFMLAVGGLPGLQHVLRSGHNAAPHLFNEIDLQRMSDAEASAIVVEGLARATRENGEGIIPQAQAVGMIVRMAAGIPRFVQHLASSAFAVDVDGLIDEEDVMEGAYGPEGAVNALGKQYGWNEITGWQDSDLRWHVLSALTRSSTAAMSLSLVCEITGAPLKRVQDAVRKLRDGGLVVELLGSVERVELAGRALAAWVRLEINRPVS